MKELKQFIKESLLDDVDTASKGIDKAIIKRIEDWAKSNIIIWKELKDKSGVRVDPETGEILLPKSSKIFIKCPVIAGATFSTDNKPGELHLSKPTESDLIAICGKIDRKHEYNLILIDMMFDKFPSELDKMSGELTISTPNDSVKNIDFNNINLNLRWLDMIFPSFGPGINVSGIRNVNIVPKKKIREKMRIQNAILKDNFGTINISSAGMKSDAKFDLVNVHGAPDALKNLKYAECLRLKDCSEFDLSKCDCDNLELWGVNDSFNYDFLPKKLKYLHIKTVGYSGDLDSKLNDIKNKIKSTVDELIVDGIKVKI